MTRVGPLDITDNDLLLAELPDLVRRRQLLGLDSSRLVGEVPPLERGTTGLAFSGGGVRAAALSLGVAQSLARAGLLRGFDYLSTVSGGGFVGSTLSSVLGSNASTGAQVGGATFPLRLGNGEPETPALAHLRTHSNYLAPEGTSGRLRLAAVLLRGVLLNVFLFLPWILIAVVLTEIAYELEARLGIRHLTGRMAMILVVLGCLLVATFPFVIRVGRQRFNWSRRNAYDMVFAAAMVATFAALALLPFTQLTRTLVIAERHAIRADLAHWFGPYNRPWIWIALLLLVVAWSGLSSRIALVSRINRVLGRTVLWLLGPGLIVAAYFVICVHFVHLPFAPVHYVGRAAYEARDSVARGQLPGALRLAIDRQLQEEGGRLSHRATIEIDSASGQIWVRDSSYYPRTGPDWLFASTNGPGGGEGVARFPVRVLERGPADMDFLVTLRSYPEPRDLLILLVLVIFMLINGRVVDVNVTSLHQFYRDRLSRAFLFRLGDQGIDGNDGQRLSDLNGSGVAPYHLINATVNVSGSANPLARGRNADFFLFSKHFCGSRCTGYTPTLQLERADSRFDFASAIAISGAAAGPRMGVRTEGSIAGDMALFNLRLGYWLPNPRRLTDTGLSYAFRGPGPSYLLRESFGVLHERGRYVNVSDGGHIENLGVYELLRRRCRLIVAIDAEADPELTCDAITTVMRYARIDLGISISIDLEPIRHRADGLSREHFAVGSIHYGPEPADVGTLIYLKASRTGDEPPYLTAFARQHPAFPHQSTADQFFTETDFEVYRALGDHIMTVAMTTEGPARAALDTLTPGHAG